jgi:outer membrane protein assembly factor BamB
MKLFIASLVLCGSFGILFAADWPQFLGPKRDNASTEPVAKTFPKEGPKELWQVDVGPGFGGPAIADGMVYLLDRDGEKGDILRCIDLVKGDKGEKSWSYAYDAPSSPKLPFPGSRSTPLVDKDYVFTIGVMGDMNCISKTTHRPVWTKHLLKDFGGKLPVWAVAQSPVAYKDTIIVTPLSEQAGVVAFSRDKGDIVWKTAAVGTMQYASPYVTRIDGVDQVIVISGTGKDASIASITGIDAAKGDILWSYDKWDNKLPIASPLNIGDGKIFLCGGFSGDSFALDIKQGAGKWSADLAFSSRDFTSYNANPVLYKGYLYSNSSTMRKKNGFRCMDLKREGMMMWRTSDLDPVVDFGLGNILLAGDVIFALNGDTGELAMIQPSPDGYKELVRAKVLEAKGKNPNVWAPMALSDGKLIVRDQHQMKCLDVKAQDK